jgi:hypothetical protein
MNFIRSLLHFGKTLFCRYFILSNFESNNDKMKTLFTILLILSWYSLVGQTMISGNVKDQKGGAILGANIYLKGTYDGVTSDQNGAFKLTTDETGKQLLTIQALGYKSQDINIECAGKTIVLEVRLAESINLLTAVTITAGAMEASDEKKAVVLKPIDIVTTSGAIGDITAAFLTLPGTSTVGNDGRLFVRGGDASETAMFIDGMLVRNAFGTMAANVPTRTRFSPNLFKGSFFSTGGYSAEFGQALSSALSLNTLDMPLRNQTDISIMSLGGGITRSVVGNKNALTASANYINLKPYHTLIKQNFDWEKSPSSWDTEVSLRHKWGKAGFIKAYAHTEGNRMMIWQKAPGITGRGQLVDINNAYSYGNLSFRQSGSKGWFFSGGMSFSHNRDAIELDRTPVRRSNNLAHTKVVAVKDFGPRFSLKNGFEWYLKSYSEELTKDQLKRKFNDQQINHFVEADYYFNNNLIARGGIRSGYSTLARQAWLTPRLSVAYKLQNQGQFSFAVGRFKQLPEEKLRVLNNNLRNTEAVHYIFNYFISQNNRTFRGETFYKIYNSLATFNGTANAPEQVTLGGSGYARGLDFFYRDKKTIKGTDFWVTYSFVDSRRKYATYQTKVQPSFAPKHNGSFVVKHFVSILKSQLGASWSWNSGYPFSDPNLAGEMQHRTKAYSDLSVSWSYLPRSNVIIHAACTNVPGRANVFGYQYASQPDNAGKFESIPVSQGARRMLFLAVFITLAKDKNANNLNNL